MVTLLLVVIYICYIGLGLPDSLLGSAWPVMHLDLNVPISLQGFLSMAVSVFTVISSALSPKAINRFGTGLVAAVSTGLTAIGLIGFALTPNAWFLFVLAIPLGVGAGAIDSALNNYVALHYSPMLVNFLHCFYGIGVTLSPYFMSLALDGADDWRKGFFIVFFIQLGITLLAFASLPIWKKIGERQAAEEEAPQTLSIRSMLKNPAILCLGIVFLASCGVELVSGTWCSTYFVSVKQVSPDDAARITSVFYIGMSLGRLVAGFVSRKWSATKIVFVASAIVVASLVAIGVGQIAPLPLWSIILAVLFLGFGVGPSFASLTLLIPEKFGRSVSQSIIGLQMSMAYVGIAALPPIFGLLVEWIGAWLYPVYLIVLMACYVVSFVVFLRLPKKIKTVNEEV